MVRATRAITLHVCITIVLALAGVQCGEGDDEEKGSLSLEAYAAESAKITCAYYAACCSDSENPLKGKTEAECRALMEKQYRDAVASAPGYSWDPQGKAGCLTILRQMGDCRPLTPVTREYGWKPECRSPGAVLGGAAGEACTDIGTLCQPGLLCLYTPGQPTKGSCQAPRSGGSACSAGYECTSGICTAGACTSSGVYTCDGH